MYLAYLLPDLSSVSIAAVLNYVRGDFELLLQFQEVLGVTVEEFEMFLDYRLLNREMIEVVMLQTVPRSQNG